MKQRKILDINSKLSAEALIDIEGKVELNLKVGGRDYRVANEEIRQLRDWLSKEVIGDVIVGGLTTQASLPAKPQPAPVSLPDGAKLSPGGIVIPTGPTASGPVFVAPGTKVEVLPLDQRRAVTTNPKKPYNPTITSIPDVSTMHNGRQLKMEIENRGGELENAREAFAPQNLNQPEPM